MNSLEEALQIEISNRQLQTSNAQRALCVLVVDASISMEGQAIDEVTKGLRVFEQELKAQHVAKDRVRVLVIRAGGDVSIARYWTDGNAFAPPTLQASGTTPLGEAMQLALDQCFEQQARVEASGNANVMPYIILLSDGEPNDAGWENVAAACRSAQLAKKVGIMCFGTETANLAKLGTFTHDRLVFRLKGYSFVEFFRFIVRTMTAVSQSKPNERLKLELPRTIEIFT